MRAKAVSIVALLAAFAACLALYAGVCLYFYFAQDRLVFKPSKEFFAVPDKAKLPYEEVSIPSADGVSLSAWLFPVENPKATILFLHGNSWNISKFISTAELYHRLGISCLLLDYRGYGKSSGQISEEGIYADAEAAYAWLKDRGVPESRIVVAGRSLGGAPAAFLVSRHPSCAGLMLEASFTSLTEEASKLHPMLPVRLICKYKFPTAAFLKNVRRPVMVVHSRDDKTVPFSNGRILFELAPGKAKSFVELHGSHNDSYFESGSTYPDAVRDFVSVAVR